MEFKTQTTLNQLRIGDSFTYIGMFGQKRTDPWRVMARADKSGKVAVNQVVEGKTVYKYDELKKGTTKVLFLRHTIPLPGEVCLLDDLQPGDQFKMPGDEFDTWVVEKRGHLFFDVRRTTEAACSKGGRAAKVIFVKHKAQ
jgi:hypothetical protein